MTNEILTIIGILLAAAASLMAVFYGQSFYSYHHIGWDSSRPVAVKGLPVRSR